MTTPHKMSLEDLWTLKTMGNVALSPDGRRVAFILHASDKEKNENTSTIFLLHLDEQGHASGQPRQLTSGVKNDTNPVWAPDSHRLLFLSDRDDKNQLWLIDTDGGEASKLTNMLHGVSDAAWSPDGKWIAFLAPTSLTDEDDILTGRKLLDDATKKQRVEEDRIRLRTITTIWYRADGQGLMETFNHLFLMPAPTLEENTIASASIRRVTFGDFNYAQPSWTPDSLEIGVLCNRNDNRDRSLESDLWAIDHETGNARCLTDSTLEIYCYSWSPDGNSVIVVGTSDLGFWQVVQAQGYPWDTERANYYRERSPLTYAPSITTPTLLIHPENDLRCPIEQSEQLYMALKMIGKAPVEFVRVPGAWHGGTVKPSQVIAYYEKMLAWFGKYLEIRPEEYS